MDDVILKLVEAFEAARAEFSKQEPRADFMHCLAVNCYGLADCSRAILAKQIAPVLAEYLADNAVVTQADLGLLGQLNEEQGVIHSIVMYSDESGHIKKGDSRACVIRTSEPVADAIRSLLKPKCVPTPETCSVTIAGVVVDVQGVNDLVIENGGERYRVTRETD